MKLSSLLAGALLLATGAVAWTNEDHEIFDIVSALEKAEGKGATFYSFLNVTKSVAEKELSKAYRKRSLELHPDKNPNDSVVADRFARLGTIAAILRDAEKRKRYDFFYDNGVPKWRGTGYYYSRWRPGFGSVVAGLIVFSCFIHYFFLVMTYFVSKARIRQFQDQALVMAWGETKKPLAGRKRLRVKTGDQEDPLGVPGINKGKPTGPGSVIEMVVEGEKVYIVEDGEELLFHEGNAVWPSVKDTWVPRTIKNRAEIYRNLTSPSSASDDETTTEVITTKDGKKETIVVPKKPKGPMKGVELQGKVGGRRRAVKPRAPGAKTKEEEKKDK
ncbi:DnaJ domain-containing protein [Leucosporidium creatinivorum]|uniref:DnaJ domain-containing protein n=1 Tax=Leucosporidium creatinivorum TaxID=106004 RepID=A0A1Y2G2W0_9BASI|nr:DnaJ domain-containing protein [Leucosporidium creatinivorum]